MAANASGDTILISPRGTLKSLDTADLAEWAQEIANMRSIPLDHNNIRSWHRPPTWCLPFTPHDRNAIQQKMLNAVKKPGAVLGGAWRSAPYARILCVRTTDNTGPFELATLNPKNYKVTNSWSVSDIDSVIVHGASIFVSLPGARWPPKRRTLLEVTMDSDEAAAAMAAAWGWEEAAAVAVANPPVRPDTGEAFVFRH